MVQQVGKHEEHDNKVQVEVYQLKPKLCVENKSIACALFMFPMIIEDNVKNTDKVSYSSYKFYQLCYSMKRFCQVSKQNENQMACMYHRKCHES